MSRRYCLVRPVGCQALRLLLMLLVLALVSGSACAVCKRNSLSEYPFTPLSDAGSAQFWLGRINLASAEIQPPGTVLGSAVATAADASGITGDTILWICDLADAGQIYEVFSTNGDDRVGGYSDIGWADGLGGGYYRTWFPGVAIKLTHMRSGTVFSRYYQSSQLDSYEINEGAKKIYIRARHLSPIKAEVARVSDQSDGWGPSNWCPGRPDPNYAANSYRCNQPNGYLMLRGPGYNKSSGDMDDDGEDHANRFIFFGAKNGIAFGMREAATYSQTPSCVVNNVTPEIVFSPISVDALELGDTREGSILLSFKCDRNTNVKPPFLDGSNDNQTAFGLEVSPGALAAARELGYINSNQGVRYLLSDGYGTNPQIAKGVGISLSDTDTRKSMNFLSSSNTGSWLNHTFPSGQNAGWYVLPRQENVSDNWYVQQKRLTVTLQKLPGQQVTPGRVYSTAYVIVKVN